MKKTKNFRLMFWTMAVIFAIIAVAPVLNLQIFGRSLNVPANLNTVAIRKEHESMFTDRKFMDDLYAKIQNTAAYKDNEQYVFKRPKREIIEGLNGENKPDLSQNRKNLVDPGYHFYPEAEKFAEESKQEAKLGEDDRIYYIGLYCREYNIQAPDKCDYSVEAISKDFERETNGLKLPEDMKEQLKSFLRPPASAGAGSVHFESVIELNTPKQRGPKTGADFAVYADEDDLDKRGGAKYFRIFKGSPQISGPSADDGFGSLYKSDEKWGSNKTPWLQYLADLENHFVYEHKEKAKENSWMEAAREGDYKSKQFIHLTKFSNWSYTDTPFIHHAISTGGYVESQEDKDELTPDAAFILSELVKINSSGAEDKSVESRARDWRPEDQTAFWLTKEGGGSGIAPRSSINGARVAKENPINVGDKKLTQKEIRKLNEELESKKALNTEDLKEYFEKEGFSDSNPRKGDVAWHESPNGTGEYRLVDGAAAFVEYWEHIKSFNSEGGEKHEGYAYHNDFTYPDGKKAKNPQIDYKPGIINPSGSLEDAAKPKFDEINQQWLLGPYTLDYVEDQLNGKKFATLVDAELFGVWLDGKSDSGQHLAEEYRGVQPNKDNLNEPRTLPSANKEGSIRNWRFSIDGKSDNKDYPRPGETFYIEIDYDPALIEITRIEFEFMYMVYGGENHAMEMKSFYIKDAEIKAKAIPEATDAIQRRSPGKLISSKVSKQGPGGGPAQDRTGEADPTSTGNGSNIGGVSNQFSAPSRYGNIEERNYYYLSHVEDQIQAFKFLNEKKLNKVTLSLEGKVQPVDTQNYAVNRAARWYESVVLEVKLGAKLLLPIGGKVWEDLPSNASKHIGFDHVFNEQTEKGVKGVKATVYRVVAQFDANKTKIEKILSKQEADVLTKNYSKVEDMFTDENGRWGLTDGTTKEAFIHTVGLAPSERQLGQNVGVGFVVEFEYDGIYYEPVLPLQTEQATETEKNIMIQDDGSSPITHIDQNSDVYSHSSMAVENLEERKWNNQQHAEIARYNEINSQYQTLGIANSIDPNGNRTGEVVDLSYQGDKISDVTDKEGETVTRVRSKYTKKTPEEYLNGRQRNSLTDEEYKKYKARFVAAETINLGIYRPDKWKYTYDFNSQTITGNGFHDGTYYSMYKGLMNFNLGLKERQAADVSILENLAGVLVSINKKSYVYTYDDVYTDYLPENELDQINILQSEKDKRDINLGLDLYKTDYIYRTSMYNSSTDLYNALKSEMKNELKKDLMAFTEDRKTTDTRQLDVFFMYKTSVYNDSIMDKVLISQLDQYYDSKLELVNKQVVKEIEVDPKKDIESQPGERDGKRVDDGINLERKNLNIIQPKFAVFDIASKDNKLSAEGIEGMMYSGDELVDVVTKESDKARSRKLEIEKITKIYKDYQEAINSRAIGSIADGNNMDAAISYTSENITKENEMRNFTLAPSQRADVYMAFRVKNANTLNDVEEKPELNGVEKLNNALQLGKFKVTTEIGSFATYDILTGNATGKVDQDSAPGNIGKTAKIFEDDTDKAYTIRLKLKKENENPEVNKRTIDGTIWEDLRNRQNRGVLTGDGKFDPSKEKGIPNMPITLEERLSITVTPDIDTTKLTKAQVGNNEYIDVPFMWPEKITADDITMDLKKATGFESHVLSNNDGYFKFIGVPAGNFVVKVNYSTPGIDTLKQLDIKRNEYPANDRLIEKTTISPSDLVETVAINNEQRTVKYYNGADFKNTMFYVEGGNNDYSKVQGEENPSNLAKTWLDKNITATDNSYLKDDEYRRIEVSQNMETFKNSLLTALHEYTKDKANIDVEKLKMAHELSMMSAQTPKINFSIEYYEKYKADCEEAGKRNVWDEYKDIYALKGIYEEGTESSQEINFDYNLHNLNLGLVQRPLTKFKTLKEISNIKLLTADGNKKIDISYELEPVVAVPAYDKVEPTGYNYGKYSTLTINKKILQDQSTGIENVLSLDRTEGNDPKQGFRYINVDQNLMQDATIQIEYKIFAFNLSEVDKKYNINTPEKPELMREKAVFMGEDSGLGELNYQINPEYEPGKYVGLDYYVFTNRSDEILPPEEVSDMTIQNIMDIADNTTTIKLDDKINEEWTVANKKDLVGLVEGVNKDTYSKAEYVDEKGVKYIDQKDPNNANTLRSNILLLKHNDFKLKPTTYKYYVKENIDGTYQIWTIRLDRTISAQADKKDLKFENIAEVVEYATDNYRHSNDGVTGNVINNLDIINGNGNGLIPGVGEANNNSVVKPGENNKFLVAVGEADSATSEMVTLSPPTGLSKKETTIKHISNVGIILQITFLTVLSGYLVIKLALQKKLRNK